jgi:hypothetical protein
MLWNARCQALQLPLVGPWKHGGWSQDPANARADSIRQFILKYFRERSGPWFAYFSDKGRPNLPSAQFETERTVGGVGMRGRHYQHTRASLTLDRTKHSHSKISRSWRSEFRCLRLTRPTRPYRHRPIQPHISPAGRWSTWLRRSALRG